MQIVGNQQVPLKAGQFVFGRKVAAKETGMSEQSVRTCIDSLRRMKNLTTKSTNKFSVVTIVNWSSYQSDKTKSTTKSTCKQPASNQQVTTSKQVNNKTIGEKFVPPTVPQVKEYCEERKNTVDPETFIDFYSATNWMRGRNKVKDWKACVRTWEKNRRDTSYSSPANLSSQEYFL